MVRRRLSEAPPSLWAIVAAAAFVVARAQQVPCYFVFGDSVFDNGNNNNLNTTAKVNHYPYGVDFTNGPTGRFSNGRNIPDVLAEFLGFKDHIPPFARASPAQLHTGVNYASGGAGILDKSGEHLGDRISFGKQIKNHESAMKKAAIQSQQLQQCLYTINIGSNDYINNYFMPPPYSTSRRYKPSQFAGLLLAQYSTHVKTLYCLGARKLALFGISPIGCTPRMVASHGGGKGCAIEVNAAADLFNQKLKALIVDLNRSLAGAKFTYIDMFGSGTTMAAKGLGFTNVNTSCCTVQPGQELCQRNGSVCPDRSDYVYWDNVHATDAGNAMAAKAAYMGPSGFPYSIHWLVTLP